MQYPTTYNVIACFKLMNEYKVTMRGIIALSLSFSYGTLFLIGIIQLLNAHYHSNCCTALQNLIPPVLKWKLPSLGRSTGSVIRGQDAAIRLENELLDAIANIDNRLSNDEEIETLIRELEDGSSSFSISEPAISSEIYGRWRLLYTTAATTSSPIQRRAVNAQQFPIYQDILVVASEQSESAKNDDDVQPQSTDRLVVKQIVKFTDTISLSVDALASTAAYPLEELQPRQGSGKIFGFNLLGVSLVGEEARPDIINRPNARIDFVFDEGNFYVGTTMKIPYPVPFRLPILRDAVKGWIDITYLSSRIRISRGNKGTTFVLLKEKEL